MPGRRSNTSTVLASFLTENFADATASPTPAIIPNKVKVIIANIFI
jgi:hypothetical protein